MLRTLFTIPTQVMLPDHEAVALYDIARGYAAPVTWLEVGVWCGRSLWPVACGLPNGSRLIGVDKGEGTLGETGNSSSLLTFSPEGRMQRAMLGAVRDEINTSTRVECSLMLGLSLDVATQVVDAALDVLVLDADHTYDAVVADLAAWAPKVRPGGVIIGHDYDPECPGVVQAFDERFGPACRKVDGTRYVIVDVA